MIDRFPGMSVFVLLLCLLLAICSPGLIPLPVLATALPHDAGSAQQIPGEAKGVSAVDVQLVIRAALGLEPGNVFDLDGSGSINAIDVQLMVNAALGILVADHTVSASAGTIAGPAPLSIQFVGGANDPDGDLLRFSWTFGDGGASAARNPLYTYPLGTPAGTYRPTLIVLDSAGAWVRERLVVTITEGAVEAAELVEAGAEAEVVVDAPLSRLHDSSVLLPQGATAEPLVITMGEAAEAPSMGFGMVPLVELGPEGTTFDEPVTVSVTVSEEVSNPLAIRVVAFDPVLGRWTDDGISNVEYLGGPDRRLVFDTTHFTFFSTSATWTITSLGTLGGTQSYAFTINNSVQVAGYSYLFVSVNWRRAFLWESGFMQSLGTLDKHSYAYGMNDLDPVQIVGYSQPDGGSTDFKAFIWDSVGGMRDLGNLGGTQAVARAINDSGEVAGFSDNALGDRRAFVWDSIGGIQDLGTLGGATSLALGINSAGEIAGSSEPDQVNSEFAFMWDSTNGMQEVKKHLPGSKYDRAFDINDLGEMVGEAADNADVVHAAHWVNVDGAITDLGTLGGTTSIARAVNDSAQVVGISDIAAGGTHAFGWDNEGGSPVMTDLNDLLPGGSGWILLEAWDINSAGDVVGWGTLDGEIRAFLLQKL
jgi:probable HAF family extracellular repeat protein